MYRVIIADDEAETRELIASLIEWRSLDLFLAAQAENGTDLYNLVNDLQPHIVLIDMRMPGLNGGELIRRLATLPRPPHIVVISGYDDFSYTKEAINAKVDGYLLKPVDGEELNQTLHKIVRDLNYKQKAHQQELLRLVGEEELPYDEQGYWLIEHLNNNLNVPDQLLASHLRQLDLNSELRICPIVFPNLIEVCEEAFRNNRSLLFYAIKNILDELLGNGGICCCHQDRYESLLFTWLDKEHLYAVLKRASEALEHNLSLRAIFIVGKNIVDIESALRNYIDAKDLGNSIDLFRTTSIVQWNDDLPLQPTFFEWAEPLNLAFPYGLHVYFHTLTDIYRDPKSYGLVSVNSFSSIWKQADHHIQQLLRQESSNALRVAWDRCDARAHSSCSAPHILSCLGEILASLPHDAPSPANEIRLYIDDNYYKSLTVQELADHFHMSRQHLTRIFKEETGVSPYAYIIDKKIKRAKVLLINPEIKISEIVNLLNFTDESHFNHAFRSRVGMSPRQYAAQTEHSNIQEE